MVIHISSLVTCYLARGRLGNALARQADGPSRRVPKRGSEEDDRLQFLSVLVEAYDDDHDPLDESKGTPQSVVAFMLEQHGMTRADLHGPMGGKTRVSEFFAGKRALSVAQIRALHKELGIPAGR